MISLALLGFAIDAWSCGYGYYNNHNNYMFSVFRREALRGTIYDNALNKFWEDYTDEKVYSFEWSKDNIMETAKKKGDKEMIEYVTQLSRYVDISDDLKESWEYPTKEELQQRKADLKEMYQKAAAYKGTRLQGQWNLLLMRSNLLLGDHTANVNYWNQTASKLPQSDYKTLMENIYACALLHTGKQREAFDIYAKQGDIVSIKWAMRKYRNLAGIQRIYEEDPNSPCIPFLIQDFVNNFQETLDCNGSDRDSYMEDCGDWMDMIGQKLILRQEADRFITYANKVVSSGKTNTPALWQTAIGAVQFLSGQYIEAYNSLDKAVNMKGTDRMLDNARAIRMVASARSHTLNNEYTKWMAGEIEWLVGKIREEAAGSPDAGQSYAYIDNHYYDILDRLVYQELAPKYVANNRIDVAVALKGMLQSPEKLLGMPINSNSDNSWNENYRGEYFDALDLLSADQTIEYLGFLQNNTGDDIELLAKRHLTYDLNFFYDLIGTKYLAENKFEKAIPYLEKVPLKFLEGQNISYYLANRDWHKAKWLVNQHINNYDSGSEEGPYTGKLRSNPKLEYCKEMIELQKRYQSANKQERQQVAYNLANNYYQASYLGDCWCLTQYGSSVSDTARVDRPDFVEFAINYLQESKASKDLKMQENSLVGLAYIPYDAWYTTTWDWDDEAHDYEKIINRNSRQFKALYELNTFINTHRDQVSSQISRCDVLKQFRKQI